ncbi:MAG: primosomal protein [Mycobacteriaceae bacterium]
MAQDIVPVELGLTEGDLITLWAPRWREDGEEWEAFLGHGEHLYCFDDAAELTAFIRTVTTHDLTDHPAWSTVTGLAAPELEPDDNHCFDIVGVPELAAGDPEAWTLSELSETLDMVRTLADVCELDKVTEVLDSTPGFALLAGGPNQFVGKEGARRWSEIGSVLAARWDEVLDALDSVVFVPEVDPEALEQAQAELEEARVAEPGETDSDADTAEDIDDDTDDDADLIGLGTDESDADEEEAASELGFWGEVGIDPIKVITSTEELWTLRCYVDDSALFLGTDGKIDVFTSPRALARHLVDAEDHELAGLATWQQVQDAAVGGELDLEVTQDNTYVLPGIADDIEAGPEAVDATQLELAVELLTDAADFADDDATEADLASSSPLGWFVSFVVEPDPNRLAPSPPYEAEAETWRRLERELEDRLRKP